MTGNLNKVAKKLLKGAKPYQEGQERVIDREEVEELMNLHDHAMFIGKNFPGEVLDDETKAIHTYCAWQAFYEKRGELGLGGD